MIALGLMATVAVLLVTSEQPLAVSIRAQAGSWSSDHKYLPSDPRARLKLMNIAKHTSQLEWGGSEEFMTDDAATSAGHLGNIFEYGMTPPPINKGYLDEIAKAQGEQAQETKDAAALAMVSVI
jgi:hypothetical protein